ncbi:MAG: 1-acyl-sn-glycerol-3-phosphate acyltransferase [Rickettsiales bacterium]|nr:1-acyl-sn-glycerol-3-phosphate acyltransferase [Rickettsiales bacterium]
MLRTISAAVKFVTFWLLALLQVPLALILWPLGRRASVWQFKFFGGLTLKLAGIRVRVYGEISKQRPLLIVGNHISVFEFMTFPATFGGSFFGKDDIAKMPVVGWFAKRWGVVFVSRRSTDAAKMVDLISSQMQSASWPMVIYPEGTTTNGSVILPFKSSMFSFLENGVKATIQPVVMLYRDKHGNPIDDQTMADDYAYFDNRKMPDGACLCRKDRSAFGQVFHVFALGGFTVEFHLLPPPPLADMDRKQIAETLHKIISDEFVKLKGNKYDQNSNYANP